MKNKPCVFQTRGSPKGERGGPTFGENSQTIQSHLRKKLHKMTKRVFSLLKGKAPAAWTGRRPLVSTQRKQKFRESQSEPERARESQREPDSEPDRVRESQKEPERVRQGAQTT